MKPVKNSAAFVIYGSNRFNILVVRRPYSDENFPGLLGLPAGTLKDGESHLECVLRSGREKLGVELEVVNKIGEGELERETHLLHLINFEARIIGGIPTVHQNVKNITQYIDLIWSSPSILMESARKGSLCSRIYLDTLNIKW